MAVVDVPTSQVPARVDGARQGQRDFRHRHPGAAKPGIEINAQTYVAIRAGQQGFPDFESGEGIDGADKCGAPVFAGERHETRDIGSAGGRIGPGDMRRTSVDSHFDLCDRRRLEGADTLRQQ
jgi:hypothetical protein